RYKTALLGLAAANVEHGTGRLDDRECPSRMSPCKIVDLFTRTRTDAENARILWQLGEYRFQQEVQGIANGCGLDPSFVVAGCLLVEDGFDFVVMHGALQSFSCCRYRD